MDATNELVQGYRQIEEALINIADNSGEVPDTQCKADGSRKLSINYNVNFLIFVKVNQSRGFCIALP